MAVRARCETDETSYRIIGSDGSESFPVPYGIATCVATEDGIIYGQVQVDDDPPLLFRVLDKEPVEVEEVEVTGLDEDDDEEDDDEDLDGQDDEEDPDADPDDDEEGGDPN